MLFGHFSRSTAFLREAVAADRAARLDPFVPHQHVTQAAPLQLKPSPADGAENCYHSRLTLPDFEANIAPHWCCQSEPHRNCVHPPDVVLRDIFRCFWKHFRDALCEPVETLSENRRMACHLHLHRKRKRPPLLSYKFRRSSWTVCYGSDRLGSQRARPPCQPLWFSVTTPTSSCDKI
ncbi:hypothetical protein EC9_31250 [Rosistilla ulvae]|uniref:Uncharacterized protein n=1 Tax=Rosistilla ulvae TaxID=1930277 RepID=A0A517M235_9BACT|nr:hypothetical protein EC9_31250 [Rosistilla ulvae]